MATVSRRLGTSGIAGSTEAFRTQTSTSVSGSAYSTLTKFGVPTGNTGSNARDRGGILMPKLKYRFRVLVFGFGSASLGASGIDFTQQVINVNKPSIDFDPITLDVYNSKAFLAGKHTWSDINISLRDDISNTINRLVSAQMQRQINVFEQTSYGAASNYKFDTIIDILDGGNDYYLERWFMEGCYLTNIKHSDLDYSSSEAQTIDLTIKYDNATQTDGLMPGRNNPRMEAQENMGAISAT